MSDKSKIEWTDATWNFLHGCTPVSPGCANCYAVRSVARLEGNGIVPKTLTQNGRWTGKVNVSHDKLVLPIRWTKPRMIFVNSLSDLFHEDVPDEVIDKAFAVMALCPQHTFQILTKRAKRMAEYFANRAFNDILVRMVQEREARGTRQRSSELVERVFMATRVGDTCTKPFMPNAWPLPNVWLGVSVENQKTADERIPHLLQTPAAVRWLSCEPLLGPVDLRHRLPESLWAKVPIHIAPPSVDWVVCGGESGQRARPMHPAWARSLRDQCVSAGVPFFFKQWGGWWHGNGDCNIWLDPQGRRVSERFIADMRKAGQNIQAWASMIRIGKKLAGRELDGREWNEFPKPAEVRA